MEGEGELKQIQTEVTLLTSLTPYHDAKPAHTQKKLGFHNAFSHWERRGQYCCLLLKILMASLGLGCAVI